MRIDLHCHSKYSQDNFLEPEAVRTGPFKAFKKIAE
jgi:predicted metal-dependent phosphoesterase TrpH